MHILNDREQILLDTRTTDEIITNPIDGSVFVGFSGSSFKFWLELLLPDKAAVIGVIAAAEDQEKVMETIHRLGYTSASLVDIKTGNHSLLNAPSDTIEPNETSTVIWDVNQKDRDQSNNPQHAEKVRRKEVSKGTESIEGKSYVVHCSGKYRSHIAIFVLNLLSKLKLVSIEAIYNSLKN